MTPLLMNRYRVLRHSTGLAMSSVLVLFITGLLLSGCSDTATGPLPVASAPETVDISPSIPPLYPIPDARQLAWQEGEMYMFVHFGVNTFTGQEWGDGKEEPNIFYPRRYDPQQWADIARETGFTGMILTAKHVDGFCLWPSKLTEHSVAACAWRDGKGDVVKDVAEACRKSGLQFGVYIALWDRNNSAYNSSAYNNYFTGLLEELLTKYGPVYEIWMDMGHEDGIKEPPYDLDRYSMIMRRYQPGALLTLWDIRWIGNENGIAPETQWSVIDGSRWYPSECDVSLRSGWFWRADDQPKTLDELLNIYFHSVGHNSVFLLNVPPDSTGLLSAPDVARLREFRAVLDSTFAVDHTRRASAIAGHVRHEGGDSVGWAAQNVLDGKKTTFWATDDSVTRSWLEIRLDGKQTFNVIELQEAIQYGQRIRSYTVEAWMDGRWTTISEGTTIGYKKLDRVPTVTTEKIRVKINEARACPAIRKVGLFREPGK